MSGMWPGSPRGCPLPCPANTLHPHHMLWACDSGPGAIQTKLSSCWLGHMDGSCPLASRVPERLRTWQEHL